MKRTIIAALAASMLATTGAYADMRPTRMELPQASTQGVHVVRDRIVTKKVIKRKVVTKRWSKGKRVANWQRQREVRDWNRHGLRRPGHNQRWIRVGNDYLLIGITSGIIAGILAGQ